MLLSTSLACKPHLVEWLTARYPRGTSGGLRIAPDSNLHIALWELLLRRPASNPIDRGNLTIELHSPPLGKRAATYNYLTREASRTLVRHIEVLFWAEVHLYIDHAYHRRAIGYMNAIAEWMSAHSIQSISEEALQKSYYRWRCKARPHAKRTYRHRCSDKLSGHPPAKALNNARIPRYRHTPPEPLSTQSSLFEE